MITLYKHLWKPLAGTGLLLLALFVFSRASYQAGYEAANLTWQIRDEHRQKKDAQLLARWQAAAREEEKRRLDETSKTAEYAEQQIAEARASAAVAQSVSDRLRTTLSELRHQIAASETGKLSATAAASATRASAIILLADVLESADKRAGELAEYADRARIAGETCEKMYAGMIYNSQ